MDLQLNLRKPVHHRKQGTQPEFGNLASTEVKLEMSEMERSIELVVVRRPMEVRETPIKRTPEQAIREVEELRRIMIDLHGDPDAPMERTVTRRFVE